MMLTGMEAVNVREHAERGNKPYATTVQKVVIFKFPFIYLFLTILIISLMRRIILQ